MNATLTTAYEKEFIAVRYAVMCQSSETKTKAEGFKNLLLLAKKMKWFQLKIYILTNSLQDELIRNARSEGAVASLIGNIILESKFSYYNTICHIGQVDPAQLQTLDDIETFFIRLHPKDQYTQAPKIREYALAYFNKGHFSQFNAIFSRFIKNMKDMNEYEMNEFIIRYVIASVIKKNFEIAITDIITLKNQYILFDLNFYILLISGNYNDAAESVLTVSQNVSDLAWKLVAEEDMAFYMTMTLLLKYQKRVQKEIQMSNTTLIYKLLEDNLQYLELLENYGKCRFEWVSSEFEKYTEKIMLDPFLANNFTKINNTLKKNILKEILKGSAAVSIDYLAKTLHEKDTIILESWILNGISEDNLKVKVDEIDKVIYSYEPSSLECSIEKTFDFVKETYNNSLTKIWNNMFNRNIDHKGIKYDELKQYPLDKKGSGKPNDDLMGQGIILEY